MLNPRVVREPDGRFSVRKRRKLMPSAKGEVSYVVGGPPELTLAQYMPSRLFIGLR